MTTLSRFGFLLRQSVFLTLIGLLVGGCIQNACEKRCEDLGATYEVCQATWNEHGFYGYCPVGSAEDNVSEDGTTWWIFDERDCDGIDDLVNSCLARWGVSDSRLSSDDRAEFIRDCGENNSWTGEETLAECAEHLAQLGF